MYGDNAQGFKDMSDEQRKILMEQLVPQWSSGIQTMTDKIAA